MKNEASGMVESNGDVFDIVITSMIPAPPGTYAIFEDENDKSVRWKEPVPAWGTWTSKKVSESNGEPVLQHAGPLVIHSSFLELVPAVSSGKFVGIRYGTFQAVESCHGWDNPKDEG